MVKEKAYAKINVALEVMEKIEGYHKVNNLMIPISIYDELILRKADEIFVINDKIENNICIKAASLFLNHFNISSGVSIELKKNIPLMAGLAGGSSDAAATLRGLNKLYHVGATDDELRDLASKLGSDVPFFIETKAALCTNKGEKIHPLLFEIPKINILLIKPYIGLSTKEVYENYIYDKVSKEEKICKIYKALENNNISLLKENIFNDLTKPALSLSKELKELYFNIKKNNIAVYLSGSGPTMYLVDPFDEEINMVKQCIDDKVFIKKCHLF